MSWHVDSEMQAAKPCVSSLSYGRPACACVLGLQGRTTYCERRQGAAAYAGRAGHWVHLPHNPPVQETGSVNGEQESLAHQDSCPSRATGCIHLDSGRGDDSDRSF
ncbi:hypothetical protein ACJRO7_018784 [Eucalyptus globulus]|uniref:Uncharacterized protein n=1 Tax=Eucalyptus globulus TaxID=34317 RepID=A0ABD3L5U4_EUCGL